MLVISRRKGERILITTESGETIKIHVDTITSPEGKRPKVRLAFDANKNISIVRDDLLSSPIKMKLASGELV